MRSLLISAVLMSAVLHLSAAGPRVKTFVGEISDSQCAMNVHSLTRSHQEMLKGKWMGTDNASCVRYCVKQFGGEFVLVVGDRVYHLDNQAAADFYAARTVTVVGTLDAATNTIHVTSMKPVK